MIGHSAKKVDWKAIASYNLAFYIYNCLWFFLPHSYILVFFHRLFLISLLIIMYYFSVWMCAVKLCVCMCLCTSAQNVQCVQIIQEDSWRTYPWRYPLVAIYSWITEQIWNTCSTSLVDLSWYIFPDKVKYSKGTKSRIKQSCRSEQPVWRFKTTNMVTLISQQQFQV